MSFSRNATLRPIRVLNNDTLRPIKLKSYAKANTRPLSPAKITLSPVKLRRAAPKLQSDVSSNSQTEALPIQGFGDYEIH